MLRFVQATIEDEVEIFEAEKPQYKAKAKPHSNTRVHCAADS